MIPDDRAHDVRAVLRHLGVDEESYAKALQRAAASTDPPETAKHAFGLSGSNAYLMCFKQMCWATQQWLMTSLRLRHHERATAPETLQILWLQPEVWLIRGQSDLSEFGHKALIDANAGNHAYATYRRWLKKALVGLSSDNQSSQRLGSDITHAVMSCDSLSLDSLFSTELLHEYLASRCAVRAETLQQAIATYSNSTHAPTYQTRIHAELVSMSWLYLKNDPGLVEACRAFATHLGWWLCWDLKPHAFEDSRLVLEAVESMAKELGGAEVAMNRHREITQSYLYRGVLRKFSEQRILSWASTARQRDEIERVLMLYAGMIEADDVRHLLRCRVFRRLRQVAHNQGLDLDTVPIENLVDASFVRFETF